MHAVVGVIHHTWGETVFIARDRYRRGESSTYFAQDMDAPSINFYVTA